MTTLRSPRASDVEDEPSLNFERLVFFSDAVFAIVITLLVLPLAVDVELPEDAHGLAYQVMALWPKGLTFVISFLVIGQFWMAHHRMFGHLNRYDQGLLWANLVCLMTVCFMSFPSAVLGSVPLHGDNFAVVFFAASMGLTSTAMSLTWLYAVKRNLTESSLSQQEIREFTTRSIATTIVFLISVGLAFFGLWAAAVGWLILLPIARVGLGRVRLRPRSGTTA
ncbi:MAG: TMEM175 family protein [Candidatus Nanopelagicales bacterium]